MRSIIVPDVRGRDPRIARKILKRSGLERIKEVFVEDRRAIGKVVNQSPEPEEIVSSETPVTIYISQKNLVRYLPSIYQPEHTGQSQFLHRYLWIFQHFFTQIDEILDNVHELFRPYTVPKEFLPWLASWFGLRFGPTLSEQQKRLLIKRAVELFARRGTAWEIKEMVKLFTGMEIEIVEEAWPYNGIVTGEARIGVDTMILPQIPKPFCFIVRVPMAYDDIDPRVLRVLYEILNTEKPAHTNYLIQFEDSKGVKEEGEGEEFLLQIGMQAIGAAEVER